MKTKRKAKSPEHKTRLGVHQSYNENKRAFIARLVEAGWPLKEARAEFLRIQSE